MVHCIVRYVEKIIQIPWWNHTVFAIGTYPRGWQCTHGATEIHRQINTVDHGIFQVSDRIPCKVVANITPCSCTCSLIYFTDNMSITPLLMLSRLTRPTLTREPVGVTVWRLCRCRLDACASWTLCCSTITQLFVFRVASTYVFVYYDRFVLDIHVVSKRAFLGVVDTVKVEVKRGQIR